MSAPVLIERESLIDRICADPYRLWSFWDMYEVDAQRFLRWFNQLYVMHHMALDTHPGMKLKTVAQNGEVPKLTRALLDQLEPFCQNLGLTVSEHKCVQVRFLLGRNGTTWHDIAKATEDLAMVLATEMEGRKLLFVQAERRQYYEMSVREQFGDEVFDKLKECHDDLEEAAKSLALNRPTACVFHLMRVMESVVKALGKKMGIPLFKSHRKSGPVIHDKQWDQIINEIDSALKSAQPKTTAAKARIKRLKEVAVSLGYVRDAWRNETMHPAAKYTEAEAIDIYNQVKAFLRSVVKVI